MDLAKMRLEYETAGIREADFASNPIEQFDRWFGEAVAADVYEPNAMVVSTVDTDDQPWSRFVLLKGVGGLGFEFFTNYESNKSKHLINRPRAALTFSWLQLHRQVNIAGTVERLSDEESDRYWGLRTRGSQLGGWASQQSTELTGREQLTERFAATEERFPDEVPRPPHWGGWRVVPHTIEFWQGRLNRLHDRLRYTAIPDDPDSRWKLARLSP